MTSALREEERHATVALLERAVESAFPSAFGVPANRIGATPQQDFYFRRLLRELVRRTAETGVPALAGSIDDLWCFVETQFADARRELGSAVRGCSRETVRQFAVSHWRHAFDQRLRIATFDTRTFDTDVERDARVEFHYLAPTERTPAILYATMRLYGKDGAAIDVCGDPDALGTSSMLRRIEEYELPSSNEALKQYGRALLEAVARYVEGSPDVVRELRRRAEQGSFDRQQLAALQPALGALRRGGHPQDTLPLLRRVLEDPEPDIRALEAEVRRLRDATPAARQFATEKIRKIVESAFLTLLTLFILAYFAPTPLRAAVRARVRALFERIARAPAESRRGRPAHSAIIVTPPVDSRILEQRIDARETAEFAYISPNVGAACVDGSVQAFAHFLSVPNTPPFVVLRNNEIVNSVETVPNGEVTFRDYNVLPNRAYSYRLAKLDPATGEYRSSMPMGTTTPRCRPDNAAPILDVFSVAPVEGDAPLTVTCHAIAHDPDGDRVRYYWSFGDDEALTTTRSTITHSYKYRQNAPLTLTVLDDRGGASPAASQQQITIVNGPPRPLLSQVEEYKQFKQGEAHPDGGPVGTLFHFRVFPRRSPVGAKPVLYRWSFDECRRRFDQRTPHPMPPNADCASLRLSTPEYQRRFMVGGQYTANVEVTYDDGEVEVVPIATVNVGLRERVWYGDDGAVNRAGIPVPPSATDPDAYTPIKGPPEPPEP